MTGEGFDWLGLLRAHTDRFADLIADADLDVPVTFCPNWSLRDLVIHLGGVHRWAAHAVVEGNPDLRPEHFDGGRSELVAWYRQHASRLIAVLADTPADAPAWTMDQRDRTAGFWRRRQVHETVMHVWDAEQALGETRPIDPLLAWNGVLEVSEVFYPRQVRLARIRPLPTAVRLVATDVPGDVTIGDGEAAAMVRERAEVLLRLLWHRVDADAETTDPRAARVLTSVAVTP
ncbi:maleylpyruvate isomerase family mycothiol-dependent enzyme [Flexivirga caeni]|uniref:Maleylpyruvate isomerase family mycothiol-dependent enzyme n=1 Tax=Flexivirga caeni TaxID=2294115 RepID=A0A3M9MIK4_9MICO|nr:maleylpyruvate isomerase family mycothiol-dependent enzyme [Flexivirga caeni]RNI25410.1 maleylpyruvate isomerase family mycothiol-dependent enzyme [Flexivirga caeni]